MLEKDEEIVLDEEELPERGTGLKRGTARKAEARGRGKPLTDAERKARHARMKFKIDVVKEGVYTLEPGEYEIGVGGEALSEGEDAEIVTGAGIYHENVLKLDKEADVWVPAGSTLWFGSGGAKTVPFALTVTPTSGKGATNFKLTISGAKPDRKVQIKVDKGWALDPIIAEMTGNGTATVNGDAIAAKHEGIIAKLIPGTKRTTKSIGVYGQEKSWYIDRKTAKQYITLTYGGIIEEIEKVIPTPPIPGIPPTPTPTPPTPVTPEEAKTAAAMGKILYLKCTLPLLNMLPSPIPYSPGMPVLPGFVISETP